MTKIDARGWVFQVSDGATTPAWLEIAGINEFELNPDENGETTDTTTFSADGVYQGFAMQRGASLEIEGFREHSAVGVVDPGQLRVDVLGGLVGTASHGQLRFRHDSETLWTVWTCFINPGEVGGGNNDMTGWAATFSRSGAATTAAVV